MYYWFSLQCFTIQNRVIECMRWQLTADIHLNHPATRLAPTSWKISRHLFFYACLYYYEITIVEIFCYSRLATYHCLRIQTTFYFVFNEYFVRVLRISVIRLPFWPGSMSISDMVQFMLIFIFGDYYYTLLIDKNLKCK